MDNKIIKIFKKHHIFTLATSINNEPYCASCFYTFNEKENLLIFTSDEKTRHIKDCLQNTTVAGTVALETKIIGKIEGIQFKGIFKILDEHEKKICKALYLKRFPYAVFSLKEIWAIEINFAKLTHNTLLGIGQKLIYEKL